SSSASLPSASAGQLPANLGRSDSLSVLKAIAERAKSDYERAQKLAEKQAITQSELANKKADYDVSFARIRQAEQVLRQRQVELQLAELEYKALTEAQAKAPGSVPSLELEKQKLKVEFAKA